MQVSTNQSRGQFYEFIISGKSNELVSFVSIDKE